VTARGRLLSALILVSGCASTATIRLEHVRGTTITARERGAYRCAPIALARAEAHADFARIELGAGELMRAEHDIDIAEIEARRALDGANSCAPIAVAPPAPPPVEAPRDSDGDGIDDAHDKCPHEAEDRDGWDDDDGCPDPDNDEDGIPDTEDRCPVVAGVASAKGCPDRDGDTVGDDDDRCPDVAGDPAQQGCPAPKLIVVKDDKIELKQKIHFATGQAKILSDSFPLLGEITEALRSRPKVKVRIEGHTDARGSAKLNTKLSNARAEAVRAYLVAQGIDGARLTAVGFGPSQPIADNRTSSGREQNRRVEFFLLAE
jgi:outer membrane protein OmpA-like peptidoglycan-associated protein